MTGYKRGRKKGLRVFVAGHSGFCFGVKRAVRITNEKLKSTDNIYSLGPLIHNNWVVRDLSRQGLKVVKDIKAACRGAFIVIPSHGMDPRKRMEHKGVSFVDATCPFVFKAQALVKDLVKSGYEVLILGDKDHPEVKGLMGISENRAKVIDGEKGAAAYAAGRERVALVSQTTQSLANFARTSGRLIEKGPKELRVFNTICRDVIERQKEARNLARKVDLMLVIGGRNSANTKRLAEVCAAFTNVRHIQSESEIETRWFKAVKTVGIVTGASTPGSFIKKVKDRIRNIK
ncbi:MAG: 4-hydroxy-3-methylbut-2-enyl diphosphate reductase [Candidatus Omnitrophota bacterium]